jgi:hypothetical protein
VSGAENPAHGRRGDDPGWRGTWSNPEAQDNHQLLKDRITDE